MSELTEYIEVSKKLMEATDALITEQNALITNFKLQLDSQKNIINLLKQKIEILETGSFTSIQ